VAVLRPSHLLAAVCLAPALALAPAVAHARPSAKASHRHAHVAPTPKHKRPAPPAQSVGSPTDGHLIDGAYLHDAPYIRRFPVYAGTDARWGLDSLVGLIERAARAVRKKFPDAVLSVGQLSRKGGGDIDRHASHESGRDVDIGFYIKNTANKPIYGDHLVSFLPDGTAPSWPGARFDDARNWALVASLVGDGRAHITHIFVATPIRARLLEYAAKIGAPHDLRVRASQLMAQPRGSLPHDDHFHVRIACPAGMKKCVELPKRRAPRGAVAHGHSSAAHAGHASSRPPAPASRSAGKPESTPAPARPSKKEEENASVVPTLGPIVPGLDTAIIAAPLAVPSAPARPGASGPAPTQDQRPIDDPDGVLEPR
jgi:penicillin-insensitive murein endopeptidase